MELWLASAKEALENVFRGAKRLTPSVWKLCLGRATASSARKKQSRACSKLRNRYSRRFCRRQLRIYFSRQRKLLIPMNRDGMGASIQRPAGSPFGPSLRSTLLAESNLRDGTILVIFSAAPLVRREEFL